MPLYDFTSDDGVTIERAFRIGERPDEVTEDGVTYRYDFASTVAAVQTPPPGNYPRWSTAAGFIPQPGAAEQQHAADVANGVPCELDAERGRRRFDSPAHERKWLKANHKYNADEYLH